MLNILAISGSVRKHSSNTTILKHLASQFPADTEVKVRFYDGLETLPHFNPDLEKEGLSPSVEVLRALIQQSDAVLICTPEYAFGIPGSLKNALDWMVSSGEFNEKPVAAITASPLYSGGDKAMFSLIHTLTALGTIRNDQVTLSIPMIKKVLNEQGELTSDIVIQQLASIAENILKLIPSKS